MLNDINALRMLLVAIVAVVGLASPACDDGGEGDGDGDTDADMDGDGDMDTDTDADMDGDGDMDADTDADIDGDVDADVDADADADSSMDGSMDGSHDAGGDAGMDGSHDAGGDAGDAVDPAAAFCADFESTCSYGGDERFADEAACLSYYEAASGDCQTCVTTHLGFAASDAATHCPHATGLGPCATDCSG